MKLKFIFLIPFFSFIVFPLEVFSHPGSRRQCFNNPQTFRLSGDFSKAVEGEEPWWKGVKWSGGNPKNQAKQYKCMHGGLEKHKKNKGSGFCHSHGIDDKNWPKSRQWWLDYDTTNRGGYFARCRKTE